MDRMRNAASNRQNLQLPSPNTPTFTTTNFSHPGRRSESDDPQATLDARSPRSPRSQQEKRRLLSPSASSGEHGGGEGGGGRVRSGGESASEASGLRGGTSEGGGSGTSRGNTPLYQRSLGSGASFYETPGLAPPVDTGVARARKGSIRSAVRKIFGGGGGGGGISGKRRSREIATDAALDPSYYYYGGQEQQPEQTQHSGAVGDSAYLEAPAIYPSPARHGYHSSEPPPLPGPRLSIPRESPEDNNASGDIIQRAISVPAPAAAAAAGNTAGPEFQRARSPYAVEFPRSAKLKPLALGDPFYAPGSQLRRRKTLPSLQIADSDAAAIAKAISSASEAYPSFSFSGFGDRGEDEEVAPATASSLEVPGASGAGGKTKSALARSKRRSRSADDLRREVEGQESALETKRASGRKRSDEIRYWRESYAPDVLYASGFHTLPSPPDVPAEEQAETEEPGANKMASVREVSAAKQIQPDEPDLDVFPPSAIGTDMSEDLEDRIAKLENGLLTFSDELRRITAGRNRSTVVVGGRPLTQHLRSGSENTFDRDDGRTASMLIQNLSDRGYSSNNSAGRSNNAYTNYSPSGIFEGTASQRRAHASSPPQTPIHHSSRPSTRPTTAQPAPPTRPPPSIPKHEPSRSLDTAGLGSSPSFSFPAPPLSNRRIRSTTETSLSKLPQSPQQRQLQQRKATAPTVSSATQQNTRPTQIDTFTAPPPSQTAAPPLSASPYPSTQQPTNRPFTGDSGSGESNYTFRMLYTMLSEERAARRSLEKQVQALQREVRDLQFRVNNGPSSGKSTGDKAVNQEQPTDTLASAGKFKERFRAQRDLEGDAAYTAEQDSRSAGYGDRQAAGGSESYLNDAEEDSEPAESATERFETLRNLLPASMLRGDDRQLGDEADGQVSAPELLARQFSVSPHLHSDRYSQEQQQFSRMNHGMTTRSSREGERMGVVSRFSGESVEGFYPSPPVGDEERVAGEAHRESQMAEEGGGEESTVDSPHEEFPYPPWNEAAGNNSSAGSSGLAPGKRTGVMNVGGMF